MNVHIVPCLRDNYAYLVHREGSTEALVVDPSEAPPVLRALEQAGLRLVGILNTHHHWDHVGGNEELVKRFAGIDVFGHATDQGRIPAQTRFLQHGAEFEAAGVSFRALHIPGHTLGAVGYATDADVFTGDTLFAGGCGRLFEGTPAMMYESLNVTLGALPDATRVYCGHEYTQNNLRFAEMLEPSNVHVKEKAARVAEQRKRGEPSVPSTLGSERLTNPFLRCDSAELVRAVAARLSGDRSPAAILGAVRAAKDAF